MAKQTGSIDLKASKNIGDIATDTAQYFWFTSGGSDNGAHVTEVDKATFQNEPSGGNTLITSEGFAVRDGLSELARFGANGAQIGADGCDKVYIGPNSLAMTTSLGYSYFDVDSDGGGTESIDTVFKIPPHGRSFTFQTNNHTMMLGEDADFQEQINGLQTGDNFVISMKIKISRKRSNETQFSIIGEQNFTHTLTVGTNYHDDAYSCNNTEYYYKYDVMIQYASATPALTIYVYNVTTTLANTTYKIEVADCSLVLPATLDVPLIQLDGKCEIRLYLDNGASSSTPAINGSDKDLFNAVLSLGWFSDVIV